jgi:VCBS repeat-containing protein
MAITEQWYVNPQTIRTADYDLNGIGDLVGELSISENGTILSGTSSSGYTVYIILDRNIYTSSYVYITGFQLYAANNSHVASVTGMNVYVDAYSNADDLDTLLANETLNIYWTEGDDLYDLDPAGDGFDDDEYVNIGFVDGRGGNDTIYSSSVYSSDVTLSKNASGNYVVTVNATGESTELRNIEYIDLADTDKITLDQAYILLTNNTPTVSNISKSVQEDDSVSGTLSGSDADGDSLSYAKVSGPSHGSVSVNTNGTFTYTPEANYSGTDSFTYKVNDGYVDSFTATVTITVTAVNDLPTISDASFTVAKGSVYTVQVPTGSDADGDTLSYSKVSDPVRGSVVFNSDGSFSYTPEAGYFGEFSFDYIANDAQGDSQAATITLSVDFLASPTRYFIRERDGIFLELESAFGELPIADQDYAVFGGQGADEIYVGGGATIDATDLGTGANKIYLQGAFADYDVRLVDPDTGAFFVVGKADAGRSEIVKVVASANTFDFPEYNIFNYDPSQENQIYFADGHVALSYQGLAANNDNVYRALTADDITGTATQAFPISVPTQSDSATRVFIRDSDGAHITSFKSGAHAQIFGAAGADTILVGNGTTIDARDLGIGSNKIYFEGAFNEYTVTLQDADTGQYLITGNNDRSEAVTVVASANTFDMPLAGLSYNAAEENQVYFADGHIALSYQGLAANNSYVYRDLLQSDISGEGTPTGAPRLTTVLSGREDVDPTASITLMSYRAMEWVDGTHTFTLTNEANTEGKDGFAFVVDGSTTVDQGEAIDNTQVIEVTVSSGVITHINGVVIDESYTGPMVTLNDDGRKLTLDPEYDLDLENNYSISVEAGVFVDQENGLESSAFNASFSTVSVGTSTTLSNENLSHYVSEDGVLTEGSYYVNGSQGKYGSSVQIQNLDVSNDAVTLVLSVDDTGAVPDGFMYLDGFGTGDAIYWDNQGDNAMDAAGYGQNVTAAKANTLSLWEAASGQEVAFDPLDESPVVQHTSSGPGDGSVKIILGGADYPAAGVLLNYTEYENTFLVG